MCAVEYARWDAGLWDAVGAAGRDAGCDVGRDAGLWDTVGDVGRDARCDVGRDDVGGAGLVVMGD
ncbi:hypothetical protein BFS05_00005, partial [Gardnerella vaginalis]